MTRGMSLVAAIVTNLSLRTMVIAACSVPSMTSTASRQIVFRVAWVLSAASRARAASARLSARCPFG
jgi:hypothetical protein